MAIFLSEQKNQPVFLDDSKKRKWFFRTSTTVLLLVLLGAISLFMFGLSFATGARAPITYDEAIQRYHYYYSAANAKKIAFTFDDGPHSPATENLLDALEAAQAPATFFYIGRRALVRPDLVRETVNRGFDVEDHSFTHAHETHSSYERLAFELNSTGYILSQITGKEISLYRPPYLLDIGIDPTINPYIPVPEELVWALKLGYLPVGSDIDSKDWLSSTPQGVFDGFKQGLAASPNGHIAKAIGDIVAYLREEGYSIVPLRELLTPPSGQDLALTNTLRLGDIDAKTGGEVSKLQWFLYTQKYLDPYGLTGVYDEETREAVIAFQTKNNLIDPSNPNRSALGIVGPATRQAILAAALDAIPEVPQSPPVLAWSGQVFQSMQTFFLNVYINFFPALRGFLSVSVWVMLILVVMRTLGLILLFLYRWVRFEEIRDFAQTDGPGVSILVPAYNEQENIRATLESLIRTNYRTHEIIVIDDGSKDGTAAEVQAMIDSHPEDNIRLISIENGGKANALNVGMKVSKYDLIVVLDADAVLDPEAVSYFVPHFANPNVAAVAGRVRTTNSSNLIDTFQKVEYAIGQNIDKTAFSTINAIGVVPGPAGAWRKEHLLELGGFHPDTLAEDQEMTISLLRADRRVLYEARAVSYTETPHTIRDFLKQRFRWVYGTMQCFWKHKAVVVERPLSNTTLVVMPNILIYNIFLPLTYPLADSALIIGLIFGEWNSLILPFLIFTTVDLLYAMWGLRGEPGKWKLMLAVPLQRIVYRQLLYYTVYKGLVRALEGSGSTWNKFTKTGDTSRFYLTALNGLGAALHEVKQPLTAKVAVEGEPSPLTSPEGTLAFQNENGGAEHSPKLQDAISLSVMSPNVLVGVGEESNTYTKSSSSFGSTSSR
jgi:cellulose synthase/poly-beta-1,6-N-acetylglucosamine synthase-like glycosyltransferase/peptidoglycan/xylan/chitin deacetylase (PgdA/CDA1 family)